MKLYLSILSIVSLCLAMAIVTAAQNQPNPTAASSSQVSVPHLVKFRGTVKDDTGHPKTGVVGVTFALYKDQEGSAPLWLETQNVQTITRVASSDMAFALRQPGYEVDIMCRRSSPAEKASAVRWVKAPLENLQPFAHGVYVNHWAKSAKSSSGGVRAELCSA